MIKTKVWLFAVLATVPVVFNVYLTAQHFHEQVRREAEARLGGVEGAIQEVDAQQSREVLVAAKQAARLTPVAEALRPSRRRGVRPLERRFPKVLEALGHSTALPRLVPSQPEGEGEPAGAGSPGDAPAPPQQGAELRNTWVIVATPTQAAVWEEGGGPQVGVEIPPIPALTEALDGQASAQIWRREDGQLYRVAAAPVTAKVQVRRKKTEERLVGAVLLGYPMASPFVAAIEAKVRAEVVTLMAQEEVLSSTIPPNRRPDLGPRAASAPPGMLFPVGEISSLPIVSVTEQITEVGAVEAFGVKYRYTGFEDTWLVFSTWTAGRMADLEDYQRFNLYAALGILGFGFLWAFAISRSGYGPPKKMYKLLERAVGGDLDVRLEEKRFKGPFKKLAQSLNSVLGLVEKRAGSSAGGIALGRAKQADISTLLSAPAPGAVAEPAPSEPTTGAFEAFSDSGAGMTSAPADPPSAPSAGGFDPFSSEPAPQAAAAPATGGFDPFSSGPAPQAPAQPAAAPGPVDPFAAFGGGAPDPGPGGDATVVAKVPEALLQATAMGGGAPADPDEAHFREVFDVFSQTRAQCGEPVDGLTFDRFVTKLRKNRDTLKEKYGARTVRFEVYVKENKAALKATPVK